MFIIQLEGADKGFFQFRQEMQGPAQKSHVSANRLSTGKARNRLVDDCLENGSRQVFLGRAFIDERLDVGLGKYAASGGNGVECFGGILRMESMTGTNLSMRVS